MPNETLATSGPRSFRFRSGNASIKRGIGGALVVGAVLAWATVTGRIHEPVPGYFGGWILGGLLMAALLWRGHRASVRHAESLGRIEVDAGGLRLYDPAFMKRRIPLMCVLRVVANFALLWLSTL